MQDNSEPAIQMLKANNKVISTRAIDTQWRNTKYDEILCCFAVNQIIEELSFDHSADQIDLTNLEIQTQI